MPDKVKQAKEYFVYILQCKEARLYTGYTTDIERRYQEHVQRLPKCKFTRSFPVEKLAACWSSETDYSSIFKIELKIKKLSRQEKLALIKTPQSLAKLCDAHIPALVVLSKNRLDAISLLSKAV
jgi:putative endonuclease